MSSDQTMNHIRDDIIKLLSTVLSDGKLSFDDIISVIGLALEHLSHTYIEDDRGDLNTESKDSAPDVREP